ncbi:MAG TPA: GSU2403 family nucleotidyltransferase fold protein [Azonexus sp.]|nr:GSU2403 family nucleotidyltransferase fold protein [Azonexus sp.]
MAMRQRMAFAVWSNRQVSDLRKLGFAAADKDVARVLVELHNLGAFSGGLIVVGSLAHMAWQNELGIEVRTRREGVRSAARQAVLELGATRAFMESPLAGTLPFTPLPGEPARTVARLGGVDGLPIEFRIPGNDMASDMKDSLTVAGGRWSARNGPFYEFLLESPESGALLAGGHCIPVLLPQAARLVWHTLFLSSQTDRLPAQVAWERQQSLALGAALIDDDPWALLTAWEKAPAAMTAPIRPLRASLLAKLAGHPELRDLFDDCLRGD